MKIRYVGGPLNRRSFYGRSAQPKYRNAAGDVLDYPTGRDLTSQRARDEVARVAVYFYNPQRCEYVFAQRLIQECDTARLVRELEGAA